MIDINCDMGEVAGDALLMPYVTSANVACGAHAGGEAMARETIRLAESHGVKVGAHPGYPDRANFGRVVLAMPEDEVAASVYEQIIWLSRLTNHIRHVKPHGALYNAAAKDTALAEAIGRGVAKWSSEAPLVGLAGSLMLDVWRGMGFSVLAEGFADRTYLSDGSLKPRREAGAVITDPKQAAAQAERLAHSGRIDTICLHSDTPNALENARAIHARLTRRTTRPQAHP